MLEGSPCRLIFETDVSQSDYGAPESVYADLTQPSLIDDEAGRQSKTITLGSVNGPRARGCIIRPVVDDGDAADGAVVNVRVLTYRPVYKAGSNSKERIGWIYEHIGDLVCTAGADTMAKPFYGSAQAANYRIVDTLVYTPTAKGVAMDSAFGPAAVVHSPADGSQAQLIFPELGGAYGVILDPTDSVGFNALCDVMT